MQVRRREVPDYHLVVRRPMSFAVMRAKLSKARPFPLPPLPVQTGRTSLPPTHTSPRPGRVPYERASALGVCAGPRATALRPHAEPDRLHLHAPLPPLLFSLPCPLL